MIFDGSRYTIVPGSIIGDIFSFNIREKIEKEGLTGAYYVIPEDTSLDIIASQAYGRADFWWIIADCNSVKDLFSIPKDTELFIPTKESAESVYYKQT